MRLLDLQLLRFGPFTALSLDFASGGAGLHLVFGPNEAGKSTALRAVSGLLFGIPERTQDAHVHPMLELRVGACLESRTSERIQVVRCKRRKGSLLGPDGTPLDEAALSAFLGGVGRELFETMFGLSHDRLVEGGKALLEGRGELGESLYGAGSGARLKLAALVLEREIERYGERHQGPVLRRAGELFRRMTVDSFQGLNAGFDDAGPGRPALRASQRAAGARGGPERGHARPALSRPAAGQPGAARGAQ